MSDFDQLFKAGNDLVFDDRGLIPAVVQDDTTGRVLMLGYMNEESLRITFDTGRVTFFSRSRNSLWTKGETSGNTLELVEIRSDCDGDGLLVKARPTGPTCHTGSDTCWGESNVGSDVSFLDALSKTINERVDAGDDSSYTVRLVQAGPMKVAQKVGEEGVETALEGAAGTNEKLAEEAADLLYHLLVLLKARDMSLDDVLAVLKSRHQG